MATRIAFSGCGVNGESSSNVASLASPLSYAPTTLEPEVWISVLPVPFSPVEQRVHRERIVGIRRVDHRVDALRRLDERRIGIDVARERLNAALLQRGRGVGGARQPEHRRGRSSSLVETDPPI